MRYDVKEYLTKEGSNPFRDWLRSLEPAVSARIQARILRFELGNVGDYKSLGGGLLEARFRFGSGYRIYFAFETGTMVLLLAGGDKRTQQRDIRVARKRLVDYETRT